MADEGKPVDLDPNDDYDMYEQYYNKSCVLVAQSKHDAAVKMLNEAESKILILN